MDDRRVSTLRRALVAHRSAFMRREAALRALAAAELGRASDSVSDDALAACREQFDVAQRAYERVLKRLRRLDGQSGTPKRPVVKVDRPVSQSAPT